MKIRPWEIRISLWFWYIYIYTHVWKKIWKLIGNLLKQLKIGWKSVQIVSFFVRNFMVTTNLLSNTGYQKKMCVCFISVLLVLFGNLEQELVRSLTPQAFLKEISRAGVPRHRRRLRELISLPATRRARRHRKRTQQAKLVGTRLKLSLCTSAGLLDNYLSIFLLFWSVF